jgi:hypothetical protein
MATVLRDVLVEVAMAASAEGRDCSGVPMSDATGAEPST